MKRTAPLRTFLIVLAVLTAVAPVIAFQIPAPHPRFEGKVITDPTGPLNPQPINSKELSEGAALRSGWDLFRGEYGAQWDVIIDNRSGVPVGVQGQGIPTTTCGRTRTGWTASSTR